MPSLASVIVQFSPSGSTVFVGCVNGICSLYEASSGQLVRRLQRDLRHGGPITVACFASDSMLAVGDRRDDGKHKLTLFDTTTGLQRWEKVSTRRDEFAVSCAAFSQDRATLAAASFFESKVKLFDAATGELHTEINLCQAYRVIAAICSHDSFLFITVAEPLRPVPGMTSFSTNGTNIKRNELDLYGLGPGPQFTSNSVFSRNALYDVATGKLRVKKRPPGRGVG